MRSIPSTRSGSCFRIELSVKDPNDCATKVAEICCALAASSMLRTTSLPCWRRSIAEMA